MKLVAAFACLCALGSRVGHAFVHIATPRPALAQERAALSFSSATAPLRQRNSAFMAASFQLAPRAVSTSTNRRGQGSSGMSMGLFGLGAPEIAVCLAVAALILGPDKLAGVAKDVGKMAGELKDVPKEFQAGIEEGEAKANAAKGQQPAELPSVEAPTEENQTPAN